MLYFVDDKVNGDVFYQIIIDIIKRAHNINLHVVSVTSDMGSSNRAMWKAFGITSNSKKVTASCSHPVKPGKRLYFLADVPHLIKNLRAALIRSDVFFLWKHS